MKVIQLVDVCLNIPKYSGMYEKLILVLLNALC